MQDHPGAPGTARQGPTRIIMLVKSGGNATQPRAPGHERPLAAPRAARHGRLSAATGAPGADVPLASTAGAPGQHCLSAAPRAPGAADVPLATMTRAPGQHRLSAAPIATAPMPAGASRLRQAVLPRVPATPNTLTYPHSGSPASSLRRKPQSTNRPVAGRRADSPSLPEKGPGDRSKLHHTWHYPCGFGLSGVRSNPLPIEKPTLISRPSQAPTYPLSRSTTHQVHPAIQVPPLPRSCSTAATGFLHHPSRAPPPPAASSLRRKPQSRPHPVHPCILKILMLPNRYGPRRKDAARYARPPAARGDHRGASPFPPRHMVERGPGDGPQPHHTWHYPCGCGPSAGEARRRPYPPRAKFSASNRSNSASPPTSAGHP